MTADQSAPVRPRRPSPPRHVAFAGEGARDRQPSALARTVRRIRIGRDHGVRPFRGGTERRRAGTWPEARRGAVVAFRVMSNPSRRRRGLRAQACEQTLRPTGTPMPICRKGTETQGHGPCGLSEGAGGCRTGRNARAPSSTIASGFGHRPLRPADQRRRHRGRQKVGGPSIAGWRYGPRADRCTKGRQVARAGLKPLCRSTSLPGHRLHWMP